MSLREFLFISNLTSEKFAYLLHITPNYMRQICCGAKLPGKKLCEEIEKCTKGLVSFEELRNYPKEKNKEKRKEVYV